MTHDDDRRGRGNNVILMLGPLPLSRGVSQHLAGLLFWRRGAVLSAGITASSIAVVRLIGKPE